MSSYRNSPRRQSHAIDLSAPSSNINRNNSTTSSASSGYSYSSESSAHSQSTSASSTHGSHTGHKRGQSDVIARARFFETGRRAAPAPAPAKVKTTLMAQSDNRFALYRKFQLLLPPMAQRHHPIFPSRAREARA